MNKIDKIVSTGLCLGCGLCETIATSKKCEMKLNDKGFYYPHFKETISKTIEKEYPIISNSRWIAFRLLEGDTQIIEALKTGKIANNEY